MATLKELGKSYAEYLKSNFANRAIAVGEIVKRINELRYTETNLPLTKADKLSIVDEIESALSTRKTRDGYVVVEESVDSSSYIELIDWIRAQMEGE